MHLIFATEASFFEKQKLFKTTDNKSRGEINCSFQTP